MIRLLSLSACLVSSVTRVGRRSAAAPPPTKAGVYGEAGAGAVGRMWTGGFRGIHGSFKVVCGGEERASWPRRSPCSAS